MTEPTPQARQLVQQILEKLPPLEPERHALLIVGMGTGVLVNELLRLFGPEGTSTGSETNGYLFRQTEAVPVRRLPLWVIESDAESVEAARKEYDWSRAIEVGQLRFFTGQDAVDRMVEAIDDSLTLPITNCIVSPDADLSGISYPDVVRRVQTALQARMPRRERLAQEWEQTWRERRGQQNMEPSSPLWRQHYGADKKLKVLLSHTRFAMFTRYCIQALGRGFEQLGHDVHVLIEGNDAERSGPDAVQYAVNTLSPDLIVTINYPRFFFENAGCCLEGIPLCCWIQDPPWGHEYGNPDNLAQRSDLDFYFSAGYEWAEELEQLGYGSVPIIKAPTDPEVFSPGEPTSDERSRLGCDVSCVSTISQEAVHEIFATDQKSGYPHMRRMHQDTYERLQVRLNAGGLPFSPKEYEQIIREYTGTQQISPAVMKQETLMLEAQPGRVAIRGLSVQWLLEAGFDVHLYGSGWEEHPVLGSRLRGRIPYGQPLASLLRASSIHLCNHGIWTLTMKVLDCLATGTFPMVQWIDPVRDTGPITDWFVEGRDVVLYRTRDELVDKCRYYLEHPDERQEIARRGREIVLKNFTYRHVAADILATVRSR